jgi:uncharacterized protein YcnI
MKLPIALIAACTAALAAAAVASGHVTMNPEKAPADSFSRFAVRVPTEEDGPTVKVSIQLPAGLDEVTFQPKPPWKRTQSGRVVTWSGGQIGPSEFDEFGLSVHLPNTPGKVLVFPATQTYANGKVVHWIGALTSDEPAPHVTLEAAESETPTTTTTTASPTTTEGDDDDHDWLALGFGIGGLAAGLFALGLTLVRKRRA